MRRKLLYCLSLWVLCAFTMVVNAQEAKTDYTDAIVNADLSTTDAWNAEGTKGIKDGMVKVGSQAVYDFSQTITLPAGQYKMTAKAVYRYGDSEQAEYDAMQAGTETHKTKLYAETATKKYEANVQNRNDGASDTDYAAGNGSVTINGKFVPNSSAAVQAWFDGGQYVNELVFDVLEDGQVKIGITTADGVAGDYVNIGAWTLTRLGDVQEEQVDDVVFTMVQNEADLVAGEKYLIMAEVNGGWVALSDLYAKTPCYNPSDTLAVSENWTVETVVATAVSETVGLFLGAPYLLTLEGAAGAWKFKDEVNGAYLYWNPTSKNTLSNDVTGSTFAISFNQYAHNAVIELAETAGRTLQYNSSSPRFACYTSTQAPVYLFKAGEVSVAPVAPSNPSFTSIGELLAFEVGNMVELVLSDAKITYLKGNNMSITDGVDTIAVYDYNIPAGYAVDGLLSGKVTATLSEYKFIMKKAMIRHWIDGGDKHFTVTCKDTVTDEWEFICSIPYTNLDEIDVTPAWKELEKEKYSEFFVDLLNELRKYCNGFIVDKPATTIKKFLDLRAKNIGIESVELPIKKAKSCVNLRTNLEGATIQNFDPNKYVWAYRFI